MVKKYEVVQLSLYGTSVIGVYMFTNNRYTLVPAEAPEKIDEIVRSTLGTEIVRVTIGKTPLIGVFVVGNDHGLLVPDIVTEDEFRILKQLDLCIDVLKTKHDALGNLILTNNRATLVSPLIEREHLEKIRDVLGTETFVDTICESPLVGALAVANSRGVLVSADARDEDLRKLKDMFKTYVDVGTVNKGKTAIRGGLVANDRGALVGDETTGLEIVRIIEVLGYES